MSLPDNKEKEIDVDTKSYKSKDPALEFEVFKLEYDNLAEGYRHTYQTIWQAGSVFTAISAALLSFGVLASQNATEIGQLIKWVWPLPFLFWWLSIFTPMDRYGKLRLQRLQELEKLTHSKPWGHKIEHFSYQATLKERQKLLCLSDLRVGWGVDIFSVTIIIIWIIFIIC